MQRRRTWPLLAIVVLLTSCSLSRSKSAGRRRSHAAAGGRREVILGPHEVAGPSRSQLCRAVFNLVKTQEWTDLSGKFKTVAHYIDTIRISPR